MALSATIFKVELSIADVDRGYYGEHALTLARHPSETDERLMVRLVAFAHAAADGARLRPRAVDRGRAGPVLTDLTGAIRLWIDVGLPDEKSVRRAAGRADAVRIYAYGGRAVGVWWDRVGERLMRQERLSVIEIPRAATEALAARARPDDALAVHDPGRRALARQRRGDDRGRPRLADGFPRPPLTPAPTRRRRPGARDALHIWRPRPRMAAAAASPRNHQARGGVR